MKTLTQKKNDSAVRKSESGKKNTGGENEYSLQKMKDGFLLEQSCRGNSKATIHYYQSNIERFLAYLEETETETDTSSISKEQLRKYIQYLKNAHKWQNSKYVKCEKPIAPKSIQTYIRAIRVWICWMEEEGYIQEEVTRNFKLPKASQ